MVIFLIHYLFEENKNFFSRAYPSFQYVSKDFGNKELEWAIRITGNTLSINGLDGTL